MKPFNSRIAPTPSGYLHPGNLYNFICCWLLVRGSGGRLRLRIDDLDAPRATPAYESNIFDTLHWLGMDWDEGPRNVEEQQRVFSQQQRVPLYESYIERLIATGKVFACTCSRSEMLKQRADGQYPGTCKHRNLPLDTPDAALRIDTESALIRLNDLHQGQVELALDEVMKDFVIRRKDGIPAYQVASLADDLEQGINLVVRGMDLLLSTGAQLFLAQLLGEERFLQTDFYHHGLLLDAGGEKLSKSAGNHAQRLHEDAQGRATLIGQVAAGFGLQEQAATLHDLLQSLRQRGLMQVLRKK